MNLPDIQAVKKFLLQLQDTICQQLSNIDGAAFEEDSKKSKKKKKKKKAEKKLKKEAKKQALAVELLKAENVVDAENLADTPKEAK